jgi:hypothetical protein
MNIDKNILFFKATKTFLKHGFDKSVEMKNCALNFSIFMLFREISIRKQITSI